MASPLTQERPRAGTRLDGPLGRAARRRAAAIERVWVGSPVLRTAAALGWIGICVLVMFHRAILWGLVYYESDTVNYYVPVRQVYDAALARGELPLWTPNIYAGFPIFADGEGGMLYPVNVVLTLFLAPTEAHVAQLLARFWLAGAFAYWFARTLRLSRLSALVAGLVFTFSSFTVGQLHHTNVGNSAIWLPAVLGCAEMANRSRARGGLGWSLLGGLALANAFLGIHVQPVLMTLLTLGLWTLFRAAPSLIAAVMPATRRAEHRSRADDLRSAVLRLAIAPLMVAVAVGVAAAQLVPLYELSRASFRGEGVTYAYASTYGPNAANLVGLIFPAFFQGVGNQWWSLWSKWESTIYVGVAPLALAFIAAAFRRSRETWFFAALAVATLLIALGDYSPVKLFWLIWQLPGFSVTRAPGRFSFLFTFAVAMLAAYGMQWLLTHVRTDGPRRTKRRRLLPLLPADPFIRLRLLGLAAIGAAVAITAALVALREWLLFDRGWWLGVIRDAYLTLGRDPRYRIGPETIVASLEQAASLFNPRTALAIGLVCALAACFVGWSWLRRHPNLWHALLVGLITVDLLVFAIDFHPVMAVSELEQTSGIGRFLVDHPGGRHYHRGTAPNSSEPNRLLPWDRPDAGGYSSLEFTAVTEFLGRLQYHDGALLDMMGIRYLVQRKETLNLPNYQGVRYDVGRPLSVGVSANPNSKLALAGDGVRATELRLVAYLRDARSAPQGQSVGEVRVRDAAGRELLFPLRAGVEVADDTLDLPDRPPAAHARARPAFYRPIAPTVDSPNPGRLVGYYSAYALGGTPVESVRVDFTAPVGQLQVVGAALVDASGEVAQLTRRAKYTTVYEDEFGWVDENAQAGPRAFLVYNTVAAPGGRATLDYMVEGPFDPARQAVIQGPLVRPLDGGAVAGGSAAIVRAEDRLVEVDASAPADAVLVLTDTMYPGWRVFVDGREAPLLTADTIFRAVFLPAGQHRVAFVYDPLSVKVGAGVSVAVLALTGLAGIWVRAGRRSRTTTGNVTQ